MEGGIEENMGNYCCYLHLISKRECVCYDTFVAAKKVTHPIPGDLMVFALADRPEGLQFTPLYGEFHPGRDH